MKLIDANELKNTLFIYAPVAAQSVIGFCIDHAPTVDVVHCRNCTHRSAFKVGDRYQCQLGGYVKKCDFCSRGEKNT